MTAERVAHWGTTESHLLFDPQRYGPFAAAFHVAGHHWARHRLEMDRTAAGLRVFAGSETLLPGEREQAPVVEASAVLVEALAIEAAVCADAGVCLGEDVEMDWVMLREHCGSTHRDSRRRGCRASAGSVEAVLVAVAWLPMTGARALRDWAGISTLADCLGRGQVLEADEVQRVLQVACR